MLRFFPQMYMPLGTSNAIYTYVPPRNKNLWVCWVLQLQGSAAELTAMVVLTTGMLQSFEHLLHITLASCAAPDTAVLLACKLRWLFKPPVGLPRSIAPI